MVPVLQAFSSSLVVAFAGLLLHAAVQDFRHYIISNRTVMGVIALFALFLVAQLLLPEPARLLAAPVEHLWKALILALVVFAGAAGLFAAGVMGGGDVKLLGAVTLWAGPQWTAPFLLLTALAGGLVTLVVLLHAFTRPVGAAAVPANSTSPNLNPLRTRMQNVKVPYGLGISGGGLMIAWFLASRANFIPAV